MVATGATAPDGDGSVPPEEEEGAEEQEGQEPHETAPPQNTKSSPGLFGRLFRRSAEATTQPTSPTPQPSVSKDAHRDEVAQPHGAAEPLAPASPSKSSASSVSSASSYATASGDIPARGWAQASSPVAMSTLLGALNVASPSDTPPPRHEDADGSPTHDVPPSPPSSSSSSSSVGRETQDIQPKPRTDTLVVDDDEPPLIPLALSRRGSLSLHRRSGGTTRSVDVSPLRPRRHSGSRSTLGGLGGGVVPRPLSSSLSPPLTLVPRSQGMDVFPRGPLNSSLPSSPLGPSPPRPCHSPSWLSELDSHMKGFALISRGGNLLKLTKHGQGPPHVRRFETHLPDKVQWGKRPPHQLLHAQLGLPQYVVATTGDKLTKLEPTSLTLRLMTPKGHERLVIAAAESREAARLWVEGLECLTRRGYTLLLGLDT
mmetsp:Transcript_46991/g.102104  ORF Transcript_46991/g.102104 Transcript_46991/m.102104 type:complete len:428 (+) Transcript_46991:93-1376(+)